MFAHPGQTAVATIAATVALMAAAGAAFAAQPTDWQIWHQPAASPGMQSIIDFDWLTLYVIVPITLFVMALLAWVMFRYRASKHPVPEKTTHNTAIEVVWTLGPVVILVFLAIPSFQLLTSQFVPPKEPALTVKATGYQWYWGYEYQDEGDDLAFDSRPIGLVEIAGSEEKANEERETLGKTDIALYPRLLAVDNEMVVPVNEVTRVLVTAGDVIHNFAVPAFGQKMDGYPGRLNETFFMPVKEGLFYGQCSELCGKYHAYMPIAIRVVSAEEYAQWRASATADLQGANRTLMARVDPQPDNKNDKVRVAAREGETTTQNQ